jgi:hypothetical protein
MNEDNAHGGLLRLIGELLYKNQLLREALASKDEAIELIINHLMVATASGCSCGIGEQVAFVRDMVKASDSEVASRKTCCFNEFGNIVMHPTDGAASTLEIRRSELQKNRG